MKAKKFLVIKDIQINSEYTIKAGKHLLIEDGMDGDWWTCIEDGNMGCPFYEYSCVQRVVE